MYSTNLHNTPIITDFTNNQQVSTIRNLDIFKNPNNLCKSTDGDWRFL